MNIKKRYSIAAVMATILIIIVAFQFFKTPKPLKVSGAGLALDHFFTLRAWPDSIIPHHQYEEAFKRHQQMRNLPKKKDSIAWEAIGPKNFSGRMIGLAFNPQNPNTIWGGSASGGLWKTETDGIGAKAWQYISTGFPVLGVMAIAVNPTDSNEVYAGTGEVYHYRKSGEGIGDRTSRGTYGVGILKSTDNGVNWTKVLDWDYGNLRGVNDLLINPLQTNTVWAATTEGLYVSYNAGNSWDLKVTALNATDVLFHPKDTSIIFVACGNFESRDHGIYRSLNGGLDFEKISNGETGLPTMWSGKTMLDIQSTEPFTLFASIANTFSTLGLFSSIDTGKNWTRLTREDYATYQGWFSHDVAVHPENENEVVVVGVLPYKSSNGGKSLNSQSGGGAGSYEATPIGGPEGPPDYCHSDIHRVMYHPTDFNKVYYVTDGGIFVSLDGGLTFESRNGGLQTQQFYADFSNSHQDSLFAIGGMQDNHTAIYEGNNSWRRAIGGDGLSTAINPLNDSIVYGSFQWLGIQKSTNKALSFSAIPVPEGGLPTAFAGPYAMCEKNPDILYAGRSKVFKTEDGTNWDFTSKVLDGNYVLRIAVASQNCDLVYASTSRSINPPIDLFKSTDGAQNWEKVSGDLPKRYILDIVVHPENEEWVYVAVGGYKNDHLYKSEDGAATWKSLGELLPDVPVNSIVIDTVGGNHIYIGTDIGVYVSDDDGTSWTVLQNGLPDAILAMDVSISPLNRKLRVATHGSGVYQRPLLGKVTVAPVDTTTYPPDTMIIAIQEPLQNLALSIKPNPVSEILYIESEPGTPLKMARIYSVDGKLQKSVAFKNRQHKIELPVYNLPKGIYQLMVESEEGFHQEKIVVR